MQIERFQPDRVAEQTVLTGCTTRKRRRKAKWRAHRNLKPHRLPEDRPSSTAPQIMHCECATLRQSAANLRLCEAPHRQQISRQRIAFCNPLDHAFRKNLHLSFRGQWNFHPHFEHFRKQAKPDRRTKYPDSPIQDLGNTSRCFAQVQRLCTGYRDRLSGKTSVDQRRPQHAYQVVNRQRTNCFLS
jgi:hypothetical protein